ncbi:hypothetical protein [Sinorhizobium medicae]|uniref:hypothetical protein n=1 Tax=Sinorhizobium medicae TaxID=110321 RepID=UPI003C728BDA
MEPGRSTDDLAKAPLTDKLCKFHADSAKAVLKHDAQLYTGARGHVDQGFCPVRRDLQRLFEEHMLSCFRRLPHQVEMSVWRRQYHNGRD